jgi:hypothetical protein
LSTYGHGKYLIGCNYFADISFIKSNYICKKKNIFISFCIPDTEDLQQIPIKPKPDFIKAPRSGAFIKSGFALKPKELWCTLHVRHNSFGFIFRLCEFYW